MKSLAIFIIVATGYSVQAQDFNNTVYINYSLSIYQDAPLIYAPCRFYDDERSVFISSVSSRFDNKIPGLLADAFINRIKNSKETENKIWGIPNAALNGLSLKFDEAASLQSSEPGFYKYADLYLEPISQYRLKFDKKSNAIIMNNCTEPLMTFDAGKGQWEVNQLSYSTRGGKFSISSSAKKAGNLKDQLQSVDFFESWDFNSETGKFSKEVVNLGISMKSIFDDSPYGYCPLFNFKTNPYLKDIAEKGTDESYSYKDINMIADSIIYTVIFSYNHKLCSYHENGVGPKDFDNDRFYHYIEPYKRYDLIYKILEAIKDGRISAYPMENEMVNFSTELSLKDIDKMLSSVDSVMIDDYETGELKIFTLTNYTYIKSIVGFTFYEDW
ncbi:MAG: hypothetical protein ABIJ16_09745, partial [Bacteroidota bacterium]